MPSKIKDFVNDNDLSFIHLSRLRSNTLSTQMTRAILVSRRWLTLHHSSTQGGNGLVNQSQYINFAYKHFLCHNLFYFHLIFQISLIVSFHYFQS